MDAATPEPKPAYWHLSQDVRDAIVLLLEFVTIFVYQQTCFPSERNPSDSDSSASEHSEDEEEESHSWDKAKQFTTLLSECATRWSCHVLALFFLYFFILAYCLINTSAINIVIVLLVLLDALSLVTLRTFRQHTVLHSSP
ncbi:hypothetical protein WA577_006103, partial [Blastocystis sp. JDR]